MTGHDCHEYSFAEALEIVSCSESTLRRKLNENGSELGATKLKRGWRIPVTTLEAMGVLTTVTGHETGHSTGHSAGHDRSETDYEITRLRVEIAELRAENQGLKRLLAESGRRWWDCSSNGPHIRRSGDAGRTVQARTGCEGETTGKPWKGPEGSSEGQARTVPAPAPAMRSDGR